jgi:PTH1 family peptidyl-tRNA hydrolase
MTNSSTELVIPQMIVGLGNPGTKYDQTRHNVGFMLVDLLSSAWRIPLSENRKFQGICGEGHSPTGERIRLLKPTTFMNLSGQAIRAMTDWYKLSPESVLVVYDEMDLPLGKIRLRHAGSAGGHNGMKSTIAHLGTQTFPRLRIGIGHPRDKSPDKDAIAHVLGAFSKAETPILHQTLKLAQEAIEFSLKQGIEKSMSLYNNRSVELNAD